MTRPEISTITFLKPQGLGPKLPCANKHAEDRENGKFGVNQPGDCKSSIHFSVKLKWKTILHYPKIMEHNQNPHLARYSFLKICQTEHKPFKNLFTLLPSIFSTVSYYMPVSNDGTIPKYKIIQCKI